MYRNLHNILKYGSAISLVQKIFALMSFKLSKAKMIISVLESV